MYELLFSLTGFCCGAGLGFLAAEELNDGKKYFLLLKRTLFVLFSVGVAYYYIQHSLFMPLAVFVLLAIFIFIAELKLRRKLMEAVVYLFFLIPALLYPPMQLLISSVVFLYGLPAGTLWWMKDDAGKTSNTKVISDKEN